MIIFLYGEDLFRSKEKLSGIRDKFLGSGQFGSGLSIFDFSEKADQDVIQALSSRGLFSEKRLVIVENIIGKGDKASQGRLTDYLEEETGIWDDQDLVLVIREEGNPRKNNALFKLLTKEKEVKAQDFLKLSGAKLEDWVKKRLVKIDPKKTISRGALAKLVAFVGEDMYALNNELGKLIDFSEDPEIGEESVDSLVRSKLDGNIFETIDAVGQGDKKRAVRLIEDHLEKGDDPFYIFSMLVYQFRNLIRIASFVERGISDEYQIARTAKLHPFVVKKGLSQIRSIPFQKLRELYSKLGDLDVEIKTGRIDIRLAIQRFVVGA